MPGYERWVVPVRRSVGAPRLRLICLAYAGGSPELFRAWSQEMADDVELLTIRLPGHGSRMRERPYADWKALTEDTFAALAPHLALPHAFYGHSFGGRLAYELTQLAGAAHPGSTRWLFVSGCRSPDTPQRRPLMHELSEPDFRAALRGMGGTPAAVLADDAVMKVLLPAIWNEIRLAEIWDDRHGAGVGVPITAMYGRNDPIDDRAAMSGWPSFSRSRGELLAMPGGHFFLETHRRHLIDVINARLEELDG